MKSTLCTLFLLGCIAAMGVQVLNPATDDIRLAPFGKTSKAEKKGEAIAVELQPNGGRYQGVIITPPKGQKYFDLSDGSVMAMDVKNCNPFPMNLRMEIVNLRTGKGANSFAHIAFASIALGPGEKAPLRVRFGRAIKENAKWAPQGMQRLPDGFTKGDHKLIPGEVAQFRIWTTNQAPEVMKFELSNFRTEEPPKPLPEAMSSPEKYYPFVDRFGQYKHADWPGKVKDEADFRKHKEAEDKALAAYPEVPGRDRFGGWAAGPNFPDKKGGWDTVKYKGKWFLVTPEGNLFWSLGMNSIQLWEDPTAISYRENYFEKLPPYYGDTAKFYTMKRFPRYGFYKGKGTNRDTNILQFSFMLYNLSKKYGEDYAVKYLDRSQARLRSWGFNTNGNWVEPSILTRPHLPYISCIKFRKFYQVIEGCKLIGWKKFPDVFNPAFAAGIEEALRNWQKNTVTDEYCIGYFIDNELSWGKTDTFLAEGALRSPGTQPAKIAMTGYYKQKYGSDIARLNAVWGTSYTGFDDFLNSTAMPKDPKKAQKDLEEFNDIIANRYFSVCKEVINREAPGKLYFGCRFNDRNEKVIKTAAKYLDGCSFNLYRPEVSHFSLPGNADMPVVIGEWHYGTFDRGFGHPGLQPSASQTERARGIDRYIRSALWNPLIVGAHYFKFTDQALTGRPADDENIQCGFVDVTDTPYQECVDATRKISEEMYDYRTSVNTGK